MSVIFDEADIISKNISFFSKSLRGSGNEIGPLLSHARSTFEHLEESSSQLGKASVDFPKIVENLGEGSVALPQLLKDIDLLVKGLHRHWLFRRSVERAREDSQKE